MRHSLERGSDLRGMKMTEHIQKGEVSGELCNRNGCVGVIEEILRDGCCSCHINPPCSYCIDAEYYCPVRGWGDD
jgi:hypothetical protein